MRWNLRMVAAERGIWKSTELRRQLADAGLEISAGKMSGLWTGTPTTIRLEDLAKCTVCGLRPVAWSAPRRSKFCYDCMPGGPYAPPPCRRCGRTDGYYSAGLCDRCHRSALQPVAACRDCHAWGVTRTHQWLCDACRHWRKKYPQGNCTACSSDAPVNGDQVCRLCWSQFITSGGRKSGIDLLEANRFGQQLFLANLRHTSVGQHRGTRRKRQNRRAQARHLHSPPSPTASSPCSRRPATLPTASPTASPRRPNQE